MAPAGWSPSRGSRLAAAAFLVSQLGVVFGGSVILERMLGDAAFVAHPHMADLWRAGHSHAAVLLILALACLPWIDVARLSEAARWFARVAISSASITFPLAFFFAVPTPAVERPGPALWLLWPGGALFAAGIVVLTIGLLRRERDDGA